MKLLILVFLFFLETCQTEYLVLSTDVWELTDSSVA